MFLSPEQGDALKGSLDRVIESHAALTDELPRRGGGIAAKDAQLLHAAARSALAHLGMLMKLIASGTSSARPDPAQALAAARAAILEEEGAATGAEEGADIDDAGDGD
jgi:hypothetical protein